MAFLASLTQCKFFRGLVLMLVLTGMATTVLVATPQSAVAQDEEKPGEKEGGHAAPVSPIVHFFVSIGWAFGLLFTVISVGMVALIIIMAMDLRMSEAMPPAFVDEFTNMVNKRQFKQAFELCRNDNSFLARVMTAGMGRLQYGIEDARESMLAMLDTVKSAKDATNSYLATIGTLGPMLGLVGTVSGMVEAFRKLGEATKAPDASELAGSISHALVVTLVGVGTSVPAIFFFTFFKNRTTAISMAVSNLADDLLTQMYHNSKKAGGAPATQPATAADKPSVTTNVQAKA